MCDNLHKHPVCCSGNISPRPAYHPVMPNSVRILAVIVSVATVASCGHTTVRPAPAPAFAPDAGMRELTADQQAAQAVNRLTFGARPGEVERVLAMGTDRWIERQLDPDRIPDVTLDGLLTELPVWHMQVKTLVDSFPPQDI